MADHTRNIKENKDSANINLIANKEAAYALTGVAVGAVYKTEDTGQMMGYMGDPSTDSFDIVGDGAGMMGVDMAGFFSDIEDPYGYGPESDAGYSSFYALNDSGNNQSATYESGKWILSGSVQAFESAGGEAHPADVITWTALSGATGTIDSVTRNEPRNWKHDGVILVTDNDEKILLTNLPDGQQVEIVGEGGRLERYNGDNAGLLTSFHISDAGSPNGGQDLDGRYDWDMTDGVYYHEDGAGLADVKHDGTQWVIRYSTYSAFESDPCDASVHPSDATGWTATGGSGTIADDGVDYLPEATESNWFTIKNTVELTWHDDWYSGDQTINGITAPEGTATNVGWVAVGERIQGTDTSTDNYTWTTTQINGSQPNTQVFPKMVLLDNAGILIPDAFPSGATITVKSS
jgi:hypothetical protein